MSAAPLVIEPATVGAGGTDASSRPAISVRDVHKVYGPRGSHVDWIAELGC